jgi:hypothetical protein
VFVVEVDHLTHARGHVRCNLCGTVFDSLETLSAARPHEDEDLLLHEFDNAPPLLTQAYQSMLVNDTVEEELEDPVVPEFVTPIEEPSEVPFVAEKRTKELPKTSSWVWAGLVGVVFVTLLWQAQIAVASGQIKLPENTYSEKLCQLMTCAKDQEDVDLEAISLVSRNIRPHPGRDNALIISASMINSNKDNQKFPALEIKLSDLNGHIVAMRRFMAKEYVPNDVFRAGFVSNTLIPVNLEIVSPGENAVAFEIGFVQP